MWQEFPRPVGEGQGEGSSVHRQSEGTITSIFANAAFTKAKRGIYEV